LLTAISDAYKIVLQARTQPHPNHPPVCVHPPSHH